jgi:hypothetical protein
MQGPDSLLRDVPHGEVLLRLPYQPELVPRTAWETQLNGSIPRKGNHKLEFYAALHDSTFAQLIYDALPAYWGKTYCIVEITY